MKAIVQSGYGGPEVLTLREMPVPQPQAGELLVKVSAIALNYANKLLREGVFPAPAPLPAIMLAEVEGIVVSAGAGVEGFRTGQRVTGVSVQGFAEYAVLHTSQAFLLPDHFQAGQGMLSGGITAHHLLAQVPGSISSVLITGAAGVIGSFAMQLARLQGIPVIGAVTGSSDKSGYVQKLGATVAVSRGEEDWLQQLAAAAPEGYALLLDAGGGTAASQLLPLLAPGGTAVLYGNMSGKPVEADGNLMAFRGLRIVGASVFAANPADKLRWHNEMVQAVLSGKLEVPVNAFAFDDFGEAFAALESRQIQGRIVLQTA